MTKLLYVTPEMLSCSSRLRRVLQELSAARPRRVARLVIDEAHCVSAWGHDFRPDYKDLGKMRSVLGKHVPLLALTATATQRCRDEVCAT